MDAEIVSRIDLRKSEDELLLSMRKNTRYLIRKGIRLGIKVVRSKDISLFMDLYNQTAARHDFVPHESIDQELRQFSASENAELLVSSYHSKPLAAAIVCYYGNQALYRHGASIPSDIPAAYILQWEIIKRAKERGYTYYNMFGIADSDRKSHPWYGLTLFKKGFGGETVQYLHGQDLVLSYRYWINYLVETIRKTRKGY
jgi:lipid II:glycine glycyltransferase (peptidoglycan interpeptide bridge formation enzyme)